jgi:LytS/YehU family sensor histidine kinase
MRFRYPMEMAQFVIIYAMGVTAIHLYYFVREARERQLAASELQTRLAQAQLHNLQLQLQPHFLFNALNTISSVMYEDPRRADAMLAQLSDLLRQTLRRQEVTLEEEVEVLRLYLRIMLERFGEELQVEVRVEPETARALVPQLLLQPLVENSIRHGARSASPLKVEVHAARQNGNLMVKVSDNGPGIPDLEAGQFRRGVGLSNTSERREAMYGADQEMQFENGRDGGLTVTVRLPFRALTEEP